MKKITHTDLKNIGHALGYSRVDGLCYGFSSMLVQAWLANDEDALFARLKFLESYGDDVNHLIKDVYKACQQSKTTPFHELDTGKRQLLEIPAFYDGIELYLLPQRHNDLFERSYVAQKIEFVYPFVRSEKLSHKNLSKVFDKNYAFDRERLVTYLSELEHVMHNNSVPAPIMLNSGSHSVCLKYAKYHEQWHYVDINDFGRYQSEPSYVRKLNTQELADSIFESFFCCNHPYTIFNTTILTSLADSAALKKKLATLEAHYPFNPEHSKWYDKSITSLLYIACLHGDLELVQSLLEQSDTDVNQACEDGFTPLFIACQQGHVAVVQALVKHADTLINKTANSGATPFYIACQNGHIEVIHALAEHRDFDANLARDNAATPLMVACQNGHCDVVKELLNYEKTAVNETCEGGATALYFACFRGHVEVVQELLKHKDIKIDQEGDDGATPFFIACHTGQIQIVHALLKHNVAINQVRRDGVTPLYAACFNGHLEVVQALLEHKNIKIKARKGGTTPLYVACQNGHIEIVRMLLRHKVDLMAHVRDDGVTPLYIACQNGHINVVQILLEQENVNVNQARDDGVTALYVACQNGHTEIVKALLNCEQLSVGQACDDGDTPLYVACQNGHVAVVQALLDHIDLKTHQKRDDGNTPFQIACQNGHVEVAQLLLEKHHSQRLQKKISIEEQEAIKIFSSSLIKLRTLGKHEKRMAKKIAMAVCDFYRGNEEKARIELQKAVRNYKTVASIKTGLAILGNVLLALSVLGVVMKTALTRHAFFKISYDQVNKEFHSSVCTLDWLQAANKKN